MANLAAAESGIDQQARFVRFDVRTVAAGTAAENCELRRHVPEIRNEP